MKTESIIEMLETACGLGIKPQQLSTKEKQVVDNQKPFFSKRHYYDEDGCVISKEEAFK